MIFFTNTSIFLVPSADFYFYQENIFLAKIAKSKNQQTETKTYPEIQIN